MIFFVCVSIDELINVYTEQTHVQKADNLIVLPHIITFP